MNIANRIKKLRENLHMDRHELAKGIVSYSHLSNIEAGRHEPSDEILIALAKRLKVPEEYLLKYKEKDDKLEQLLLLLKDNIDFLNMEVANELIDKIKNQFPFIHSPYQETFYQLLKSYCFYKKKDMKKSIKILKDEVMVLTEAIDLDVYRTEFKETYYYMLGILYFFEENYIKSYHYFIQQLPLAKSNFQKAIISFNVALVLFRLNNINAAIIYAKQALDSHLHERKWTQAGETDNLLGILYWESGDLAQSEKHMFNALDIANQYNLEYLKARVFHNLGLLNKKQNKIEKSLEYFNLSITIKKENNFKNTLVKTYESILSIYIEQEQLEEAGKVLVEAKQYCEEEIDLYHLKLNEARINLKLQQDLAFEELMLDALHFFEKTNLWNYVKDIEEELGDFYSEVKKYKSAAHFYKQALIANKVMIKGGQYEKD